MNGEGDTPLSDNERPVVHSPDMQAILDAAEKGPIGQGTGFDLRGAYTEVVKLYKAEVVGFNERLDAFTRVMGWLSIDNLSRLTAEINRESLAISKRREELY